MTIPSPPSPYPHWMLAEIYEQPQALRRTLERYVEASHFRSDTTEPVRAWLRAQRQLLIAASGSSRHAGLVGEVLLEDLSSLPVDVEYASEYSYRAPQTPSNAGVIVISQSGETVDTLMALRRAVALGQHTLAITNVPGSTMDREADAAMPTLAGVERAIPATKSFTAQLLVLELLSLIAAETHGSLSAGRIANALELLAGLPDLIAQQLDGWQAGIRAMAPLAAKASSFLFCGRGVHFPIAREGALKLKESAYIQAEGLPAGELKHGPNALVSKATPLVMIATVDRRDDASTQRYEKVVQLMEDMRTQDATILAIANRGDRTVAAVADATVEIDPVPEPLAAICEVIPLQFLAYFTAISHGIDVDRPRNLVKAVLAE